MKCARRDKVLSRGVGRCGILSASQIPDFCTVRILDALIQKPRLVLAVFGLFCVAAVGSAHALGEIFLLEVCAMCWFQRLSFLLAGAAFMLAAAWPKLGLVTQRIGELGLLLGLASAARQTYLIANPELASDNCAAGLFYYLQIEDYAGFLRAGMLGGIDCAENQPLILGLYLPQWSLLAFIGMLGLYVAWMGLRRARKVSA